MQFKNVSGSFKNVCIPYPEGPRWFTAEPNGIIDMPEEEGWRAIAHGFVKVGEEKKGSEVKDLKTFGEKPLVVQPSFTKKKVKDELRKIKGLGSKTIDEIVEEYDSIEDIISDIKAGRFSVGGVDRKKKEEILSKFK
jgi:endonuclease III-like uncharacterized protein